MLTKSQYRGVEVGMSSRVGLYSSKKVCFQFGAETWQRTGVTNVVR